MLDTTPKQVLNCFMKPYIQPFEQALALREMHALASSPVCRLDGMHYVVSTEAPPEALRDRLTYWERVGLGVGDEPGLTAQVRREATATTPRGRRMPQRQARFPFDEEPPVPNRRTLRYGPHGIHEYRGKFFPQLVRSLLNIGGVEPGDLVLDPMCGSGTTPVEASLLGVRAWGGDLNPLSVYLSRVKCEALRLSPVCLLDEYARLREGVDAEGSGAGGWLQRLPPEDQEYAARWFAPEVLRELDRIAGLVSRTQEAACGRLFTIVLSNVLRRVSHQKEDDLRIRRVESRATAADVRAAYLVELDRAVDAVASLAAEIDTAGIGAAEIEEGDARRADTWRPERIGQVDAVVTSPPYATALPYLDTDRLSLSFLNLLPRSEHRDRDYRMIGNREVNGRMQREYSDAFARERSRLPGDVVKVIERIRSLNEGAGVGFRRRNLPVLLARYFIDMRQTLAACARLLRPGAPAYVVIGNNHTTAGDERVEIRTDDLLGQLGEAVGLRLEDRLPMEMLVSRDIFRKNTGTAETVLFFRKPA